MNRRDRDARIARKRLGEGRQFLAWVEANADDFLAIGQDPDRIAGDIRRALDAFEAAEARGVPAEIEAACRAARKVCRAHMRSVAEAARSIQNEALAGTPAASRTVEAAKRSPVDE